MSGVRAPQAALPRWLHYVAPTETFAQARANLTRRADLIRPFVPPGIVRDLLWSTTLTSIDIIAQDRPSRGGVTGSEDLLRRRQDCVHAAGNLWTLGRLAQLTMGVELNLTAPSRPGFSRVAVVDSYAAIEVLNTSEPLEPNPFEAALVEASRHVPFVSQCPINRGDSPPTLILLPFSGGYDGVLRAVEYDVRTPDHLFHLELSLRMALRGAEEGVRVIRQSAGVEEGKKGAAMEPFTRFINDPLRIGLITLYNLEATFYADMLGRMGVAA